MPKVFDTLELICVLSMAYTKLINIGLYVCIRFIIFIENNAWELNEDTFKIIRNGLGRK
jgi:hypothetical protein